jgi:hypothetical protein
MAELPWDYARCTGANKPVCLDCMRKSPGRPDGWQVYIAGQPIDDITCENHISPKDWHEPNG